MSCCRTLLDGVPALSILALLAWSYYAYVIELCTYTIESSLKLAFYLVIYHFLLTMLMWSFIKTVCTDIAIVPEEYKISRLLYERVKLADREYEKNELLLEFCNKNQISVVTRNEDGYIRFCKKCKHIKPDRAHHCSKCGTCVLKMDHHCPWVNNCIGFSNYKFFVLFLCYSSLYCLFYAATTCEYFILFWEDSDNSKSLHVFIGFIVSFGFGVMVSSFSAYHMSLISRNQTTLEVLTEPTFRGNNEDLTFHIGTRQNFEEVFGDDWFLWFIPVWSTFGDGLNYPVRLMF